MTLNRAILGAYDHAILDTSLRHSIRSAATACLLATIDLVRQLKPAHLQSFWYFASKYNLSLVATLGSLLWSSTDISSERETYKSALADLRWTLRISSTGAPFMAQAIAALDASPVFTAMPQRASIPIQDSPFDPSQLDVGLQGWFQGVDPPEIQHSVMESGVGNIKWNVFN